IILFCLASKIIYYFHSFGFSLIFYFLLFFYLKLKSFIIKNECYLFFPFLSILHTVCQTCPKEWIQFQESCYFFYNLNSPWKTWDQSQQLCQNMKSDLVVISSLEEQVCYKSF
uniref:C-type lectin domain-containing protein n=1 Tax=Oryzias sinensis TaxID=183150 RepID=A0A8C7Y025_9TELE